MKLLLTTLFLLGTAAAAMADPPPENAMPLSQILQGLEAQGDVRYFSEIDWDDDDGHWEIELVRTDGSETEIAVDPVSGQPRQ